MSSVAIRLPAATRGLIRGSATTAANVRCAARVAVPRAALVQGRIASGVLDASALAARQPVHFSFAAAPTRVVSQRRALQTKAVATDANQDVAAACTKYGFEVVKTEFIKEYDSEATLFRHVKTGAEVMSLINSDENKTFGAVFRTPPENSTGIPHILEHSVLCGSRKYPIKEPFVELMKGSLNTFLNAFTYPDRTCYPVASCNLQDFYNLVDVYMDAVLHPKCISDKQTFEQEGWHYELEDPSEDVTFKGVVFNEMKGVYSSPDSVLGRECQQQLFPDNTYGVDSGGSPEVIPDLTFEEFQEFHKKFYHPSNARFWFYGDDPAAERLRILDSFLSEFDRLEADSEVKPQKLFSEPKYVVSKYAASENSEEEPKTFLAVNWLLAEDAFDLETELSFSFLNYLMLGTSASPLRKALEESGLGEAMVGGGLEDELRQPTFTVGLKGVKAEDVPKVEALVMDTLKQLKVDGFSSDAVEAAVNTIEFSLRENNTGRFPRGLSLMLRSMSNWLYEKDAFEPMKYTDALDSFKAKLASGDDIFSPLIDKYLLDNPHRVTLELQPDIKLGELQETEEKERLKAYKSSLDDAGIAKVIESTAALKKKQETMDSPEQLKCMPALSLSDIPKEASTLPIDVAESQGATILRHDLFTNDVLYVEAAFDMRTVPAELLQLVPLFCRCVTNMGTDTMNFVELTQTIGRKTGGISVYPMLNNIRGSDDVCAKIVVRGKTMADKAADMMALFTEVLSTTNFDDKDRFRQFVLETRAGMEAAVVGSGHSVAMSRIGAMDSVAGWVSEQQGGLSYLEYLRTLTKRVDADWEGVVADLKAIRSAVLARKGALLNVTGDAKAMETTDAIMQEFLASIPDVSPVLQPWTPELVLKNEGLVVPTQVNYVGKGANLYKGGYELDGKSYVISKHLGTSWLWDRVRVVGGAYGGFCDFDSHSGMFTYLSYRDPNLLQTLDNYDATGDFLREMDIDKDTLSNAIIGCIGDIDAYQLPDAKGYTSMLRYLLNISDEERQQRRDQILGTTAQDFKEFAEVLETVKNSGNIVAVASADAVAKANEMRPGLLEVKNVM